MASKQASNLPTKDNGPCFAFFNHLPWELRRMVWEEALPPPIPQILIYKPTTFPRWNAKTNTWNATDGLPTIPIPPPALLHTTQESRAFALERVHIRKVKKAPTRCTAPSAYHHIVSRLFDRDADALFIHEEHFPAFVDIYMASTPQVARHLVFDADIFRERIWTWGPDIGWYNFMDREEERQSHVRSVAVVELRRCDSRLDAEAVGDRVARGYYRAVPDAEAVAWRERLDEDLAQDFRGWDGDGEDGISCKVVVGSAGLCGGGGGERAERVLECSQVLLQRVNGSTMK